MYEWKKIAILYLTEKNSYLVGSFFWFCFLYEQNDQIFLIIWTKALLDFFSLHWNQEEKIIFRFEHGSGVNYFFSKFL